MTSLHAKVLAHDADAWRTLVRQFEPELLEFARQRCLGPDEAEDLAQAVMVALLQEPPVDDAELPAKLRGMLARRLSGAGDCPEAGRVPRCTSARPTCRRRSWM